MLLACLTFGSVSQAVAAVPGAFAAVAPKSRLMWYVESLGLSGLLVLVTGFAIFVGACLVVMRSHRPAVIAAYLVFLPLPVLIAVIGALKGCVASFSVLALTDVEISASEWYGGTAEMLLGLLIALLVTMPSFLVIAVGLFLRTVGSHQPPDGRKSDPTRGSSASVKLTDAA